MRDGYWVKVADFALVEVEAFRGSCDMVVYSFEDPEMNVEQVAIEPLVCGRRVESRE